MKRTVLHDALALGALSGMRSLAGPAALAWRNRLAPRVASALAAGEMLADKTSFVGDRVDAVPLAGRALMGALAGGAIASEARESVLLGGLAGAAAAVVMAHVAFRVRRRLPLSSALGGMLEDAIVLGFGARYARVRA